MSEIQYGFNPEDFDEVTDGGSFDPYKGGATIKMARMVHGRDGAQSQGVELTFETDNGGKITDTLWYMSRVGKTTYTDKNGKEQPLPAGNMLKSLLTVCDAKWEIQKGVTIPVYDYDKKEEVPTPSDVVPTLAHKKLLIAVNTEEYKKNNGDIGKKYVLAHVYNADTKKSGSEMRNGSDAKAYDKFEPRHKELQGGGSSGGNSGGGQQQSNSAQSNPFA